MKDEHELHHIDFMIGGGQTPEGKWQVTLEASCDEFYDAVGFKMYLQAWLTELAQKIKRELPADAQVHFDQVPPTGKTH